MEGPKHINHRGNNMEDKVSSTLPPGEYDARVEAFKKFAEKRGDVASKPASNEATFKTSSRAQVESLPKTLIKEAPKVLRPEVRASLPYLDREDDEMVMGEDGKYIFKKGLE